MEFSDATTAWAVIAAVLAAIVLIDNCAKSIERWKGKADAPTNDLADRMEHVEECLSNDNKRLTELEKAIGLQDKQNKLLMRGVMQMMTHMVDGNHVDQLRECRDEFQDFLINR